MSQPLTAADYQRVVSSANLGTPLGWLMEALDHGADPNIPDEQDGLTPLVRLGRTYALDPNSHLVRQAQALLKKKADLFGPDEAFAQACSHPGSAFLSTLVEHAAQNPTVSPTGQDILHVLAQRWEDMQIMFISQALGKIHELGSPVDRQDEQGNTPLHYLLAPPQSPRPQDREALRHWEDTVADRWHLIREWMENGSNVHIANKEGVSVLDLIQQRIKEGMAIPPLSWYDSIRSIMEQYQLDQTTPNRPNSARARL